MRTLVYANCCPFLISNFWSLHCRVVWYLALSSLGPGSGHTAWRQPGGTRPGLAWRAETAETWEQFPVFLQIPLLALLNLVFSSLLQTLSREAERGNCRPGPGLQDTRRLMRLRPPSPSLHPISESYEHLSDVGAIRSLCSGLRHVLFESHCHIALSAVKRCHRRYSIITNSDPSLGLFVWYLLGLLSRVGWDLPWPRPASVSLGPGAVRLERVPGPVGVRVVLREGRGVLSGEAGVRGDQPLLHPLLLLHSPVLKPDFHLECRKG